MAKRIRRGGGVLLAAVIVIAIFCASLPGPTGVSPGPRTPAVRTVADHTDDGGQDTGERPDKSEHTRGGPRTGILGADLTKPREAVSGLAGTVNQVVTSPNRMILESYPQDVGAGQSADFELFCPAPFKVVNGGPSGTDRPVRLTASYPVATATSTAWHVRVRNDDNATTRQFRVNADCINGLTQYQRLTHLNRELAPGADDEDEVQCPAGTRSLGGGYSLEMSDQVAISASTHWGYDWLVHWRNIGSSPSRISIYAICAAGVQSRMSGGSGSRGNEYEYDQFKCEDSEGLTLAGGWRVMDTSQNKYIIVTQAYPGPNNNYVVWAHNHNGSYFSARGICGTVP